MLLIFEGEWCGGRIYEELSVLFVVFMLLVVVLRGRLGVVGVILQRMLRIIRGSLSRGLGSRSVGIGTDCETGCEVNESELVHRTQKKDLEREVAARNGARLSFELRDTAGREISVKGNISERGCVTEKG
jgi:hypothetical protein